MIETPILENILWGVVSILQLFPFAILLYLIIWGEGHSYFEKEFLLHFAIRVLVLVILLFIVYLILSGKMEITLKG